MSYLYGENISNSFKISKANGKYIYGNNRKLLDLTNAAGSLLLGHTSKAYKNSLKNLKIIGPNYASANVYVENFSLILKKIFPEYSKFIFCVSGTEANIKALRSARAITKKNKIAMVSGSWHGSVDELLYLSKDKKCTRKLNLSNGLSNNKNTILIPYNDFLQSKKILKKHKSEIAALIIEPIQQALVTHKSESYVKAIFNFCKKNKILICFDEMVTGLRIPEFSVYKKLKITPDLITFGKIFGGGAPIGILGITKKVEKKLNNKNNKVFYGGTYSLNPLTSNLGIYTVKYILKNKHKIYPKLEKLSNLLTLELNKFIKFKNLDIKINRYSSMIRIIFSKKNINHRYERDLEEQKKFEKIKKFKEYVFKKGLFLSKNGAIFLSNENSLKDIKLISKIFKKGFERYFK